MDPTGVRIVVEPALAVEVLAYVLAGAALGAVSGLTPGLHANNFALLLASVAPAIPGSPAPLGAALVAAGVVHTFLDVVPALALGVPDAAMAPSALPGHRLVLAGRGREALRLSALGSGMAVLLAAVLALPVTLLVIRLYPLLRDHLSILLVAITALLLLTERTPSAVIGGAVAFLASAALGHATLDLSPDAPLGTGDMLSPLFAGLFGAPVLVDAMGGGGVPPQDDPTIALAPRHVAAAGTLGTLAGAIVGYLPGVSSGIAAVVVLLARPGAGAREYLVATSGVNTANTIFALFALVALGTPRTGVLVALDRSGVPVDLPLLLAAVVLAAGLGFALVLLLGDPYLDLVGRLDYTRLSIALLCGLLALSGLFAGLVGIAAFCASAAIGLVPPRFGARRIHCMGVLIGPILLATW